VFDAGLADGIPYLVMEYVEGRTLARELQDHGRLSPGRAASVAAGIAEALAAAHAAGVVHRDVKPANVLLVDGDDVKVADFGIARVAEDTTTHPSAVVGSAPYLSPEQARGEVADARSDLYGLGVVLYELLVGRPPFQADSPVGVAFKHLEEDAEPPSSVEPGIPPELDRVVMTALAKDPADRYESAGAFLAALHGVAEGPDTAPLAAVAPSADPTDTSAAAPASGGWSGWLVRAAVVLVVLVAAVAALTLRRTTRSPGQAPGGEDDPRPSVSPQSVPGAESPAPSSSGASPSTETEEEGDHEAESGGGGGSSGSSDPIPPSTEPTEPSPSPEGSPTASPEPPPSPSPTSSP
jgi:serine/threonine protein kinase